MKAGPMFEKRGKLLIFTLTYSIGLLSLLATSLLGCVSYMLFYVASQGAWWLGLLEIWAMPLTVVIALLSAAAWLYCMKRTWTISAGSLLGRAASITYLCAGPALLFLIFDQVILDFFLSDLRHQPAAAEILE